MLYVTCSADPAQGEDVVEWLLGVRHAEAVLERVETHGVPARRAGPGGEMVRYTPAESNTSGLFVSRIVRACGSAVWAVAPPCHGARDTEERREGARE